MNPSRSASTSPSSRWVRLSLVACACLTLVGCFPRGGSSDGDATMSDGVGSSCSMSQCSADGTGLEACEAGILQEATPCEFGCASGACLTEAVTGSCAMPVDVAVGQTVTGSTASVLSTHTWPQACTMGYGYEPTGPETVFRLVMDTAGTVNINVDASTSTYFGVYLRSECGNLDSGLAAGCAGSAMEGSSAGFDYLLPAGTYYIIVDDFAEFGAGTGDFELTVSESSLETCEDQIPVVIDLSSGSATIEGDTNFGVTSSAWHSPQCPSALDSRGAEQLYAFTLPETTTVTATVVPVEPAMSKMALYLRSVCDDVFEQAACAYGDDMGPPASFTETLEPGTYYLFVDDFINSIDEPQSYTLTVLAE